MIRLSESTAGLSAAQRARSKVVFLEPSERLCPLGTQAWTSGGAQAVRGVYQLRIIQQLQEAARSCKSEGLGGIVSSQGTHLAAATRGCFLCGTVTSVYFGAVLTSSLKAGGFLYQLQHRQDHRVLLLSSDTQEHFSVPPPGRSSATAKHPKFEGVAETTVDLKKKKTGF